MSNRRLTAFLLLLASALIAFTAATTKANASISVDIEDSIEQEYDSGVDAALSGNNNRRRAEVVDDLGLDDSEEAAARAAAAENNSESLADEEYVDEDYDDDDDDDEKKEGSGDAVAEADEDDDDEKAGYDINNKNQNKKAENKKKNRKLRRRSKGDGDLPQLAEQGDKLYEQSQRLLEHSEFFKTESAALSTLPKKLLEAAARLVRLGKQPSYKASQANFNTQAKKLKEQSRRIQDILMQLYERIPEYEKESAKLSEQAEHVRDVADQHIFQGIKADDPKSVQTRRDMKKLGKDYAKMLKKTDELTKSLKQIREQGDSVKEMTSKLPEDSAPVSGSDEEDLASLDAPKKNRPVRKAKAAKKEKM